MGNSSTKWTNHIGGAMITVLVSSAVDRGFEPRSGHTKDYKNGIFCFCKDGLARNKNNVSECDHMSIHRMLFQ